jgi:hypothetical protein
MPIINKSALCDFPCLNPCTKFRRNLVNSFRHMEIRPHCALVLCTASKEYKSHARNSYLWSTGKCSNLPLLCNYPEIGLQKTRNVRKLNPSSKPVFRKRFSPAAHPNLSDTWRHTTKFHLTKRGYETMYGHKYVSTYKSLSYRNAGILKQNITHVE